MSTDALENSMQPPRKHHFLPEWYLSRWKRPWRNVEVIWEFARAGPQNKLVSRYRHPSGTGYAKDLYTIPDRDPHQAVEIETKLLQIIDDRGAKALSMAELNQAAGPEDKAGLVQFMLSMLHRSPDRIAYLESKLADVLSSNPLFKDDDEAIYRTGALSVFTDLIQSEMVIGRMMEMSTFIITLHEAAHDLLISDIPLMMSKGLGHKNAFVILPASPRSLVMLAENKELPEYMARHDGKVLSKAMNDAVVIQAKKFVIGADRKQTRFIDNRLNRPNRHVSDAIDPVTGLMAWKI